MRKIIMGAVYDTDTAEQLLSKHWFTPHPNYGGSDGAYDCGHERALYRTKKGKYFAYIYNQVPYAVRDDGASGMFRRKEEYLEVFSGEIEAMLWAAEQAFHTEDIEKYFQVEEG